MKYLLLLFLTSCAYNTKLTSVVFPNEYNVYNVTGKCTDVKRLYITHGFGGDKSVYDNYPFNDSLQLNKIPGLIIYGTRDERVNYRLTERLKSTVTAQFISLDEGHESNDANLLLISEWLK